LEYIKDEESDDDLSITTAEKMTLEETDRIIQLGLLECYITPPNSPIVSWKNDYDLWEKDRETTEKIVGSIIDDVIDLATRKKTQTIEEQRKEAQEKRRLDYERRQKEAEEKEAEEKRQSDIEASLQEALRIQEEEAQEAQAQEEAQIAEHQTQLEQLEAEVARLAEINERNIQTRERRHHPNCGCETCRRELEQATQEGRARTALRDERNRQARDAEIARQEAQAQEEAQIAEHQARLEQEAEQEAERLEAIARQEEHNAGYEAQQEAISQLEASLPQMDRQARLDAIAQLEASLPQIYLRNIVRHQARLDTIAQLEASLPQNQARLEAEVARQEEAEQEARLEQERLETRLNIQRRRRERLEQEAQEEAIAQLEARLPVRPEFSSTQEQEDHAEAQRLQEEQDRIFHEESRHNYLTSMIQQKEREIVWEREKLAELERNKERIMKALEEQPTQQTRDMYGKFVELRDEYYEKKRTIERVPNAQDIPCEGIIVREDISQSTLLEGTDNVWISQTYNTIIGDRPYDADSDWFADFLEAFYVSDICITHIRLAECHAMLELKQYLLKIGLKKLHDFFKKTTGFKLTNIHKGCAFGTKAQIYRLFFTTRLNKVTNSVMSDLLRLVKVSHTHMVRDDPLIVTATREEVIRSRMEMACAVYRLRERQERKILYETQIVEARQTFKDELTRNGIDYHIPIVSLHENQGVACAELVDLVRREGENIDGVCDFMITRQPSYSDDLENRIPRGFISSVTFIQQREAQIQSYREEIQEREEEVRQAREAIQERERPLREQAREKMRQEAEGRAERDKALAEASVIENVCLACDTPTQMKMECCGTSACSVCWETSGGNYCWVCKVIGKTYNNAKKTRLIKT
jgi:hypothetical protein